MSVISIRLCLTISNLNSAFAFTLRLKRMFDPLQKVFASMFCLGASEVITKKTNSHLGNELFKCYTKTHLSLPQCCQNHYLIRKIVQFYYSRKDFRAKSEIGLLEGKITSLPNYF